MIKRKNHEVGKSFLGAWKNANKKLWIFDIKRQALEERSVEAGFAIQDFLYVPHIGDKRDDSTEEWFSDAENYLALLLQRIERKDFSRPISQLELFKVLMGLVGLSYRSSYDLHKVMNILNNNSEIQQSLGQNFADEKGRHIFAVENMINQITNQAKMFSLGSLSIIYGIKGKSFLICDRPGMDLTSSGMGINFIPVGPWAYAAMEALGENKNPLGLNFMESGSEVSIVDSINAFTIDRARNWIVAYTKEELEQIRNQITLEKVKERTEKDSFTYQPLTEEERVAGWSLKNK
ncbi:MAG: DUF4238 domain-containing protein [Bacteriovoracaceae bacterium]|nr:DUF4238 domain-containing protein [Bacteriovoracaceae bacterium]